MAYARECRDIVTIAQHDVQVRSICEGRLRHHISDDVRFWRHSVHLLYCSISLPAGLCSLESGTYTL